MRKQLLTGALLIGALWSANAQSFQDSFETYQSFSTSGIGGWTQIDGDGAPTYTIDGADFENQGYTGTGVVFEPAATTPALTADVWTPHTGAKTLNFFAAVTENPDEPSLIGPNDDWFISPQLTLSASGNELSLWAKSYTAQYGLERMAIAISTTGNTDPASFTNLTQGTYVEVPVDWTEYSYNLDSYAGQQVYIAIHYQSDDAFILQVDDFAVIGGVAGLDKNLAAKLAVYPNPTSSFINISNGENILLNDVQITDINGRTVKSLKLNGVSETQINVSELSSGVYMMNISSDMGTTTKKIVKN